MEGGIEGCLIDGVALVKSGLEEGRRLIVGQIDGEAELRNGLADSLVGDRLGSGVVGLNEGSFVGLNRWMLSHPICIGA